MNHSYNKKILASKQQGVVLLMALIMLLIVTVLGVSAVRMSNVDTQLSGNSIYSILVFQGAESALGKSKDFYNVQEAVKNSSIDVDSRYFNTETVSGGAELKTSGSLSYQSELDTPPYNNDANSSSFKYKVIKVIGQSELTATSARDTHIEGIAVQKQSQVQ